LDLNAIRADSKLETLVLTATDQKSLQGIQMAKKLRTLRVSESLLTGSFPSEVLEVTTLRHLYLSFNSFGGTVPSEIDALTALEELYLSGNDLSGALPSEIAELPELRELSFAGNLLSGTIPSEVSRMPFLKIFDVQYQRGQELITGPVPNFAEAPDLM
jgi:Leucine-rich repeat (LRR) protein